MANEAAPAVDLPGVDGATLSKLLNLTIQRISQLSKMPGFPPKLARGRYDAQKIILWYVRYLQAELKRRGPANTPDGAEMQTLKRQLVTEQKEKLALANAVTRGELLSVDSVRVAWTNLLVNCQRRLRAIPSTLGPQLTNKSDPAYIADRLKNDIDQALKELAGGPSGSGDNAPAVPQGASAAA